MQPNTIPRISKKTKRPHYKGPYVRRERYETTPDTRDYLIPLATLKRSNNR